MYGKKHAVKAVKPLVVRLQFANLIAVTLPDLSKLVYYQVIGSIEAALNCKLLAKEMCGFLMACLSVSLVNIVSQQNLFHTA